MTIYEIDSAIMGCIDSETGEVIDEETLTTLAMERDKKIENVACWIKNLDAEAQAIKAERDNLAKRQKSAESKSESLQKWLTFVLNGENFKTGKCAVGFRKSTTVEIDESLIDKKYMVEKVTYVPDKAAIKKALKSGEEVSGAKLVEKQNVQIK